MTWTLRCWGRGKLAESIDPVCEMLSLYRGEEIVEEHPLRRQVDTARSVYGWQFDNTRWKRPRLPASVEACFWCLVLTSLAAYPVFFVDDWPTVASTSTECLDASESQRWAKLLHRQCSILAQLDGPWLYRARKSSCAHELPDIIDDTLRALIIPVPRQSCRPV